MMQKSEKWLKPWHIIWEYSVRTTQWIPTWQGLNVFQKSLHHSALKESGLSIGKVNPSIAEVTFTQCTRMQNAKNHENLPN